MVISCDEGAGGESRQAPQGMTLISTPVNSTGFIMTNPANIEPGSTLPIDFKLCSIGKCDQARRKNALRNTVIFNRIDLGGRAAEVNWKRWVIFCFPTCSSIQSQCVEGQCTGMDAGCECPIWLFSLRRHFKDREQASSITFQTARFFIPLSLSSLSLV